MSCFIVRKIKSAMQFGVVRASVPCGKCEECRDSNRSAWNFRLRAEFEMLRKLGWSFGFITLTYRDSALPHMPKTAFKKGRWRKRQIPCFSRYQIKDFVHFFRLKAWKSYRAKSIRYMICSEFGEHTRRPHYHAIFALPPSVPNEEFYNWISEYWTSKFGNVIPRVYSGGYDSRGRYHQPFKVESSSVSNACKYSAKYVCKDLNFYDGLDLEDFDVKSRDFRFHAPFHVQSRSLGLAVISSMTDEQKMDLLRHGYSFIGEDKSFMIPLYLKNKLIFNNKYITDENGKRLCRREANEFFWKHKDEIFEKKVQYYSELFGKIVDSSYWRQFGLEVDSALLVASRCSELVARIGSAVVASEYLTYYGVPWCNCKEINSVDAWFLRYLSPSDTEMFEDFANIDVFRWQNIQALGDYVFGKFGTMFRTDKSFDVRIEKVRSFFNNDKE